MHSSPEIKTDPLLRITTTFYMLSYTSGISKCHIIICQEILQGSKSGTFVIDTFKIMTQSHGELAEIIISAAYTMFVVFCSNLVCLS